MRLAIYGAQGVALGAYKAIKTVFPDKEVDCFLVTAMENNAPVLGGIPVRELQEFVSGMTQEEKDNVEVFIGTPESVMPAIEAELEKMGLHNTIRLTSIRWADMQRDAFLKSGEYMPLSAYPVGCRKADLSVYKMSHYKDKALSTVWTDPSYIKKLQVGGALTDEKVAEINDATGDNISDKNGNYSELTGLYWIWKNSLPKLGDGNYCGLAHYRRILELSEDDLLRLSDNDIDVILPYPMPYEPNIEVHPKRYLSECEWNAVRQALNEICPEYSTAFKDILQQEYLYNYNVILAKTIVLDDYCRWLFPILFRIEEINDPNQNKAPNRYIGYAGEILETLYFMYNKGKLRIAHAGCRFLT